MTGKFFDFIQEQLRLRTEENDIGKEEKGEEEEEKGDGENFNVFRRKIINAELIESTSTFFEIDTKSSKKILLAFAICNFPLDTFCAGNEDKMYSVIYFLAKTLIRKILEYIQNPIEDNKIILTISLQKYIFYYDEWLEEDKNIIITECLLEYFQNKQKINELCEIHRQNLLSDEEIHLMDTSLRNQNQSLIRQIRYIEGSNNSLQQYDTETEYENNYVSIINLLQSKFKTDFDYGSGGSGGSDDIENIGKRAFWKVIKENIKNNDYTQVYEQFDWLMDKFTEIEPEIEVEISEDIITLKDSLNIDTLDDIILRIMDFFLLLEDDIIKKNELFVWIEKWDIIKTCDFEYYEILPYILRDITNKIEALLRRKV